MKREELSELYQIRNSLINVMSNSEDICDNYIESYYDTCDRITELESDGGMSSEYKRITKGDIDK